MMANVTLRYRGPLQDQTKITEEIAFGDYISDVLKHIKQLYGKNAYKQARSMLITINGESIVNRKVFKSELKDGDTVSFLPVSAGG